MSKQKPQFLPDWLPLMMTRWVKKSLKLETKSLGYPSKAAGFSEKTTGGYSHTTPMECSSEDFHELEAALQALQDASIPRHTTLMMHYKPWIIDSMRAEGWQFGNSTYYHRLHAAHADVAAHMYILQTARFVAAKPIEYADALE